jgi:arylsulfatase A-like enzyme
MLTGMNAHSSGMLGLAHRGFSLNDPSQHLAHHLRNHGYDTLLCGVQHEVADGCEAELGYDRILEINEPIPEAHASHAHPPSAGMMKLDTARANLVAEFLTQSGKKPFFLSFGMLSTHRPFPLPANDIDPNYVQPPLTVPNTALTRQDMAGFLTMARCMDDCVGIVLEALRQSGRENETLVLFTTDHGIAFPKMKCHLYDSGIGVALLIKFPKQVYQGYSCDALVSHLDIYPTLCELAGVPQPEWVEGHSLLPLLNGEKERVRDDVFSEVTYHAAYEPMRCIRTERYKYICYYDTFEWLVKPNIDDGYSKQFLLQHGLQEIKHDAPEMLFDLYYDPCERNNLSADPEYARIRKELASRLEQWMQATHDPLLWGHVPKPKGAIVNRKDGLHPADEDFEE